MKPLNKFQKIIIIGGSTEIGISLTKELLKEKISVANFDLLKPQNLPDKLYDYNQINLEDPIKASDIFKHYLSNLKLQKDIPLGFIYLARSKIKSLENKDEFDYKTYLRNMNVNLNSAVILSENFMKFTTNNSCLIYISSLSSIYVSEESLSYQISKTGLNKLSKYIAVKNAKKLRTCSILPGLLIQDRFIKRYNEPNNSEFRNNCEKYQPNKLPGSTKDIVNCIKTVLLNMPEYFTGQELILDGAASVVDHFKLISNS